MNTPNALIGIDPGEKQSGIVLLIDGQIIEGMTIDNQELVGYVSEQHKANEGHILVVIEDMRPYNARITDNIIKTIKFIGQIEWRIKEFGVPIYLVPRWRVKQWAYNSFRELSMPRVISKVGYAEKLREKEGKAKRKLSPSFAYIDDWVIVRIMKYFWKIPNANVHNKNKYGLKDHSWQALAVVTFCIASKDPSFLEMIATFES